MKKAAKAITAVIKRHKVICEMPFSGRRPGVSQFIILLQHLLPATDCFMPRNDEGWLTRISALHGYEGDEVNYEAAICAFANALHKRDLRYIMLLKNNTGVKS